jgi:pimeloyl-ACP methyl ester carboxylesterase
VLALGLGSGCWHDVADHCPGCLILSEHTLTPLPTLPSATPAIVILVHGAFGFGNEWRPVVAEARRHSDVLLAAFAWSGPFSRKPSLPAEMLRKTVQQAIDQAPPATEVVVIAHSAGGALTAYVAPRLRVPATRQVRILSIAGADTMRVAPFVPDERVNTPLGFAVGGEQPDQRVLAPGVEYVEYVNTDPPRVPSPPRLVGARRVYLGKAVGHNASIAVVALPLLRGLRPGNTRVPPLVSP